MKKKNLNKKLNFKTISVYNLSEVKGGRFAAAGTHYEHCAGPSELCTDYCSIDGHCQK